MVALNDAGPSEPGEPSEPIVIDVPGVQIAPYFVHTLNDTMALENDTVNTRSIILNLSKIQNKTKKIQTIRTIIVNNCISID